MTAEDALTSGRPPSLVRKEKSLGLADVTEHGASSADLGRGGSQSSALLDADFDAFSSSARSLAGDTKLERSSGGASTEGGGPVEGPLKEVEEGATGAVGDDENDESFRTARGGDSFRTAQNASDGALLGQSSSKDLTAPAASAEGEQKEQGDERKRYITPKDFELLKVIGMGAFGKVLQVRNRQTGSIHAMKVISKRLLRKRISYVENVQAERDILTRVRHPFVVTMHASFQTREKLFIVMDFLAGGELFLRLGREGVFLERDAAFYLAEIASALEHLHGLGILHRDLKPENILLGSDGHLCLTDFGLAKDFTARESGWGGGNGGGNSGSSGDEGGDKKDGSSGSGGNGDGEEDRASTICGTQEYMAPEMVARKGYGRAADFWSLGCIAYEMLAGRPPFESRKGSKDLFRKIMNERVKMPDGASAAACKLLKGLLNRDQSKRLGAARGTMFQVGGVAALKQAEFFRGLDWIKLERKEIDPPAVLDVDGHDDLRHFHEEFTNMTLPRSVKEMSKENFEPRRCASDTFRGFSFIQHDFALPERGDHEYDKYWNSPDADGESLSECASSVFGDDDLGESQQQQQQAPQPTPEKKKRPPRKKKKKKQKPLEDVPEKKEEEGTGGGGGSEKGKATTTDPTTGERRLTLDEIQDMMAGTKVEEKKMEKTDEVAIVAPQVPKAKPAAPAPPPKKKVSAKWETAGGKATAAAKGAKSNLTAGAAPFRPGGAAAPLPQRVAHQALPQARAAPPAPQPQRQYRPAPGSWAAKMAGGQTAAAASQQRGGGGGWGAPPSRGPAPPQGRQTAAARAAAAAPAPPPPPPPAMVHSSSNRSLGSSNHSLGTGPSSDWRNHDMSPAMSPARRKKMMVQAPPPEAEKFWPALGGDFPAPPPLGSGGGGGAGGSGAGKKKKGAGVAAAQGGSWAAKGAPGVKNNKVVASGNSAWGRPR